MRIDTRTVLNYRWLYALLILLFILGYWHFNANKKLEVKKQDEKKYTVDTIIDAFEADALKSCGKYDVSEYECQTKIQTRKEICREKTKKKFPDEEAPNMTKILLLGNSFITCIFEKTQE